MLKVFNTLGRKLEEFKPLHEGKVSFYHCGPTVYWTQQIGNMRAMVAGDLIRRSLGYFGYEVRYVRNYTDFGHLTGDNIGDADTGEDRMDKAAKRENLTPQIIADKYIAEFEQDMKWLNILEPTVKARATDYLEGMIKMVQELLDKGFAYTTPKAIYFDVTKSKNYTELSGRDLEKDKVGAGVGDVTDPNKKNPADFALWFFKTGTHKDALQFWPSPFSSPEVKDGEGFPGWHIECSTMALENLGETLDFHMGGVEHISIHHTNEIAQSEAANGKKYVNYWLHNEHLLVDGRKMGKSEGNSYVLKDLIDKGYDPLDLRYFFLQAHYRSKQNFTWEALDGARIARSKLVNNLAEMTTVDVEKALETKPLDEWKGRFVQDLEDDFNIPQGLSVLWELIKTSGINSKEKLETILDFDKVLGLNLYDITVNLAVKRNKIKDEVEKLIEEREGFKKEKNFDRSDEIRNRLKEEFNVELEDQKDKTEWRISL